jgi:hypothetical protein
MPKKLPPPPVWFLIDTSAKLTIAYKPALFLWLAQRLSFFSLDQPVVIFFCEMSNNYAYYYPHMSVITMTTTCRSSAAQLTMTRRRISMQPKLQVFTGVSAASKFETKRLASMTPKLWLIFRIRCCRKLSHWIWFLRYHAIESWSRMSGKYHPRVSCGGRVLLSRVLSRVLWFQSQFTVRPILSRVGCKNSIRVIKPHLGFLDVGVGALHKEA